MSNTQFPNDIHSLCVCAYLYMCVREWGGFSRVSRIGGVALCAAPWLLCALNRLHRYAHAGTQTQWENSRTKTPKSLLLNRQWLLIIDSHNGQCIWSKRNRTFGCHCVHTHFTGPRRVLLVQSETVQVCHRIKRETSYSSHVYSIEIALLLRSILIKGWGWTLQGQWWKSTYCPIVNNERIKKRDAEKKEDGDEADETKNEPYMQMKESLSTSHINRLKDLNPDIVHALFNNSKE